MTHQRQTEQTGDAYRHIPLGCDEEQTYPAREPSPIAGTNLRVTDRTVPETHASALSQTGRTRGRSAQRLILQLQHTHGNRYVQRVLALARKAEGEAEVDPETESIIERARGGGQTLDSDVREKMEPLFGADFSSVRIHTDFEADQLNHAVNALAFTTGADIFFRSGLYQPSTSSGQELLAHELTHVVQQGDGTRIQGKLVVGSPDDSYEQEADRVARAVMRQECEPAEEAPSTPGHSTTQIQRVPKQKAQTITFSEDEGVSIVSGTSPTIDSFYTNFSVKLLSARDSFNAALENFHNEMEFPPNKKAEPDFKDVFLDQLGELVKVGYERVLKPLLEEELPGIGQAASLISGIYKEVARAKDVAGQLLVRDFLIQTRTRLYNAVAAQISEFVKNFATAKAQTQEAWQSTTSDKEREAITGPMKRFLDIPTPVVEEFQKEIVSAYIRSQASKIEENFLDITPLGRIRVKYDDDATFKEATVELQTGSGSAQVANQINRLYGSPIDLRKLNVRIEVGVWGDLIAGGTGYYYATLDPPSFVPQAAMRSALLRYQALPGDPLTVKEVSG